MVALTLLTTMIAIFLLSTPHYQTNGFTPNNSVSLKFKKKNHRYRSTFWTNTRGGSSSSDDDENDSHESISIYSSTSSISAHQASSYNNEHENDEYNILDIDVVTDQASNEAAQSAKPMSSFAMSPNDRYQLGKSYFLCSMLWLSIAMDIITNKKKRCLIFPGIAEVGGRITKLNLVPTISLSLGFAFSAMISYFISNEFKKEDKGGRNDIENDPNNFFLTDENIRKKMHLFLCLFGIINLGAHLNSQSAPFLGMTGFVINVHNSLIAYNAFKKDTIVEGQTIEDEIHDLKEMIINAFTFSKNASMTLFQRCITFAFSLALGIAIFSSCKVILSSLLPHYISGLVKATPIATNITKYQWIGLQWSKLARCILSFGFCLSCNDKLKQNNFQWKWNKNTLSIIVILLATVGLLF